VPDPEDPDSGESDEQEQEQVQNEDAAGSRDEVQILSSGKDESQESTSKPEQRAVKIYKTSILTFKDRDRYVQGEFRFRQGYNKNSNLEMVKMWAEKEMRNLSRIHAAGIPSPEPHYLRNNVLVMDFVGGEDGAAAPRLHDIRADEETPVNAAATDADKETPADAPVEEATEETTSKDSLWDSLYIQVISYMRVMYQTCKLVHADLSEYNILYHDGKAWIIDVSQSVEHDHPHSFEFLRTDITNITNFFSRKGVNTLPEPVIFKYIISRPSKNRPRAAADDGVDDETAVTVATAQRQLRALIARREELDSTQKDDDDAAAEVDDAVFRQQYIPQNLEQVYDAERDAENMARGDEVVYQDLLLADGDGGDGDGNSEASGSESPDNEDDDDDSSTRNIADYDTSTRRGQRYGDDRPRGKRFEDPEDRKKHKEFVKEQNRERRKSKMPKHVKKRLVETSRKVKR
jgi:RIO kinase 1